MKNKILLGVSIVFGIIFINAGLNKFLNYMPVPEEMPENLIVLMEAFMQIGWLMPLIAVAEILGGLLFIPNKTRALGAIIIFPVMIGIILTHVFYVSSGLPLALVLFAINLWVIYENRARYYPLIK